MTYERARDEYAYDIDLESARSEVSELKEVFNQILGE